MVILFYEKFYRQHFKKQKKQEKAVLQHRHHGCKHWQEWILRDKTFKFGASGGYLQKILTIRFAWDKLYLRAINAQWQQNKGMWYSADETIKYRFREG